MKDPMKVEQKLALNAIKHHQESHIKLDPELCGRCPSRICLVACPAELYTLELETNEVRVEHTGCLECGTCLVVCPQKAISWTYPPGGFGIHYRHG